ncbi:hypothetical protein BJV82DRAFT_630179 [Fennellomyces sp. T-0311]|nr:hypothetical protein BJV82DRAFT_630179 [Fennellomyces sp. T-0311]
MLDCMLVFFLLFNTLKLLSAIILLADLLPTNWVARAYLYELPYDFGLGGITLYLVGISQTISQCHPVAGWLPSPIVVDVIGCAALFFPFIVSVPVSVVAGAFAESDLATAEIMVRVAHIAWCVWTFSIGGGVFYMVFRLVRILTSHHKSRSNRNYAVVKTGIVKIQVIGGTFVVCLWGFATVILLYIVLRDQIMANGAVCVFFAIAWSYIGAITSFIAQISAVISPKSTQNAALRKSRSSEDAISGSAITSTCPDHGGLLGQSTEDHAAVTFYDESRDDAILDAIKVGDIHKEWLLREKVQWESGDDYSVHEWYKRRGSDASHISQLELTAHRK